MAEQDAELVVTQADYEVARQANAMWGSAINGPHAAVLAAALARKAGAKAMQERVVAWLQMQVAPGEPDIREDIADAIAALSPDTIAKDVG